MLTTNDKGLKVGENVYDDADPKSIASLAPSQPHREVDLAIVEADEQGIVPTVQVSYRKTGSLTLLKVISNRTLSFLPQSTALQRMLWRRLDSPTLIPSRSLL